MAVWVIKGGKSGERDDRMLERGCLAMGWEELGDLSRFATTDDLKSAYREKWPNASDGRVANHAGQLEAFRTKMKKGDLVVLSQKTRSAVAIGTVAGKYRHDASGDPDFTQIRDVAWLRTEVPRSHFKQDLLYSFGSAMTFCQVKRNEAEARIRFVAENPMSRDPGMARATGTIQEETGGDDFANIEQVARDSIIAFVEQEFKGHDLERLVEGVLQAQGYVTRRAATGADGGVDIVAGSGPMGFEPPRICVQVKSSDSPVSAAALRELLGVSESEYSADAALLVSWGGFKSSVVKESRKHFFRARLWDSGDLVDALLQSYDRLSDELQAELPLKRVWTLVPTSSE